MVGEMQRKARPRFPLSKVQCHHLHEAVNHLTLFLPSSAHAWLFLGGGVGWGPFN